MTWMLVRKEPSDEMIEAGRRAQCTIDAATIQTDRSKSSYEVAGAITRLRYTAMLSASPPPTDAELDELCRMMWKHRWYWNNEHEADPEHCESQRLRQYDRTMMRIFLTALNGAKP